MELKAEFRLNGRITREYELDGKPVICCIADDPGLCYASRDGECIAGVRFVEAWRREHGEVRDL